MELSDAPEISPVMGDRFRDPPTCSAVTVNVRQVIIDLWVIKQCTHTTKTFVVINYQNSVFVFGSFTF